MTQTVTLKLSEIERLGPPAPENLSETSVATSFLCDLALKIVGMQAEPTTSSVAEHLGLPRTLAEELLQLLYREKLIEVRLQKTLGATRYAMLDHGWERLARAQTMCGYTGAAPVSLADYVYMMRLQAVPSRPATIETVRSALSDLILPESLLQTIGCVINSRRSLFLTGPPGTGKTAISERIGAGLAGTIWIPYAIEIDGQVIQIFDAHTHRRVADKVTRTEYDRRWVRIQRPLVIVAGELTLENADLQWSEISRFYEAPFQMKANGGTLVIDDFGRQRVLPKDLLNRWILPLERRIDFLTLHNGKKIEVPFEQLMVFSTNLEEKDLVDEAFLRRMGYRARLEPPTPAAYVEIFKRVAAARNITIDQKCFAHVLNNYELENRQMKACEPRDLIDRVADICLFESLPLELTPELIDAAWRNYFGTSHSFDTSHRTAPLHKLNDATPVTAAAAYDNN